MKLLPFAAIFLSLVLAGSAQSGGWNKYSSSMAGLKFDYPPDWKIEKEEAKGQIWRITINSPGVSDRDISVYDSITICSKPKTLSFEDLDRCANHHLGLEKNTIKYSATLKMNGLEIRRFESEETYAATATFLNAFFTTRDRDFLVSGYFSRRFKLDRYIPDFNKVLNSFQPLEEKPVSFYRNEKYDFALTYPASWKNCPTDGAPTEDEEVLLIIVPKESPCHSQNYISVSRMTKFSGEKNNRELKDFLKAGSFSKITTYLEFGNIHAALGERPEGRSVYRERYFHTNYPQTYELLKISEKFEQSNESNQKEAREILTTARRFLKFQ